MSHELPLASLDASELRELRETVRDAASESGYPEGVRALEESDTGLDADLWRLLAEEIGLAGVGLPEEVGGLGGLAEILAVAEELGGPLSPPFPSSAARFSPDRSWPRAARPLSPTSSASPVARSLDRPSLICAEPGTPTLWDAPWMVTRSPDPCASCRSGHRLPSSS